MRKLNSDGTSTVISGPTLKCDGGDNTPQNFNLTFNNRGHYIVEAELRNENNSCGTNDAAGTYWRLGSVDVNTAAGTSPTVSLGGVPARPNTGGELHHDSYRR